MTEQPRVLHATPPGRPASQVRPPTGGRRRVATALLAAVLVTAAGCGGGGEGGGGAAASQSGDGHSHDQPVEVPAGTPAPTVDMTLAEDSVSGYNLQLETANFSWAPEHASGDAVMGEGHAHVYVDGEKVGRVYGPWYHLDGLEPGNHDVEVTLNANDHRPYAADGEEVTATTSVDVAPAPAETPAGDAAMAGMGDGHGHRHDQPMDVPAGTPAPTVDMTVTEDANSGYNLQLETANFSWAPERASGDAVMGEGHAHVYVDGEKVGRVYGPWYHLDGLEPGNHEVKVNLTSNNHMPYAAGGQPVEDTASVDVPGAADVDTTVEVNVVGGEPEGGLQRETVEQGQQVMLRVTSDVADQVHVHGYDRMRAVTPDEPVELVFTADVAGVFEVELETSKTKLLELQVQ